MIDQVMRYEQFMLTDYEDQSVEHPRMNQGIPTRRIGRKLSVFRLASDHNSPVHPVLGQD